MRRARQRGVASIELALILVFFSGLLGVVLFLSNILQTYTTAQKVAYGAARYLATAPLLEMSIMADAENAALQAQNLAIASAAAMHLKLLPSQVTVLCNYGFGYSNCGSIAGKPSMVRVQVLISMESVFLRDSVLDWLGDPGVIVVNSLSMLRYAN